MGGRGGNELGGLAGLGELADVPPDDLHFQDPAQVLRYEAGGALGPGVTGQRPQHRVDEDAFQAVEAVQQRPIHILRAC